VAERVDTLLPYSNPATPPLFMLMTLTQNCLPFVINYQLRQEERGRRWIRVRRVLTSAALPPFLTAGF